MKIFSDKSKSFAGTLLFALLFFCLAGTVFPGCAYTLGGRGRMEFSSVEIHPIVNEADLPQAQAQLARDIADTLNREPRLRTVISGGEAELFVVISDYKRSISARSSRDTVLASKQTLTLKLKCSLLDKRTGRYYFRDRAVSVDTDAYIGTAPGLGESQSFPVLSREAARKVRDLITSVW